MAFLDTMFDNITQMQNVCLLPHQVRGVTCSQRHDTAISREKDFPGDKPTICL